MDLDQQFECYVVKTCPLGEPDKEKLLVERTFSQRLPVFQLPKLLCRTVICTPHQRSLCLSHCDNAVANKRLLEEDVSIFKKAFKKIKFYLFDKSRLSMSGYFLYESIADKINYLHFFEEMSLPDTFNSWFLVTELHVWMLMLKAMEYGEHGRILRNCIVEAMWADVTAKAKKLGPENAAAAREQVRVLGDQFQAALLGYDEGILTDDRVLASALWRRFFEKNCNSAKSLELMVRYVRQQIRYLDGLTEDDFRTSKVVWLPFDKT